MGLKTILSDIYLEIITGEVVGLAGRNGAGKTSLMNIIYGLREVDACSIRIDDHVQKHLYKKPFLIRYLPQFHFLPLAFSIEQIFKDYQVQYADFETDFPEFKGLNKIKIKEISGGQRRLIEVYIILKSAALFVLLDEPFSQLMPLHIQKIKAIITQEKGQKGFLITDHLLSDCTSIAGKFYILVNGALHRASTKDDFIRLGYLK